MEIQIINVDKLQKAIRRNPVAVRNGSNKMMRDSVHHLWRLIYHTPRWRVGDSGGGIPVSMDTKGRMVKGKRQEPGNLKKAHNKEFSPFMARIWVDKSKTEAGKYNYADLVHDGTPGGQMKARPWLRLAESAGERVISQYRQRFLREVVDNLTK
jgi:hypothetical protein